MTNALNKIHERLSPYIGLYRGFKDSDNKDAFLITHNIDTGKYDFFCQNLSHNTKAMPLNNEGLAVYVNEITPLDLTIGEAENFAYYFKH